MHDLHGDLHIGAKGWLLRVAQAEPDDHVPTRTAHPRRGRRHPGRRNGSERSLPVNAAPIALTLGDPCGIGPEITLRAWAARNAAGLSPFVALGDVAAYTQSAQALGLDIPVAAVADMGEGATRFAQALPVLPLRNAVSNRPGHPDPANAPAILESIERAVTLTRAGEASCVATCPIAKSALYEAGFRHPGHTEFLASLAAAPGEAPPRSVMMIWSEGLAVVPVTIHIALADVPGALTRELIVETARIVDRDLRERFGVSSPRIAVAGLNPHAGEAGAMGREEIAIVAPAIAELRAAGIDTRGPFPADTMFHARARAGYDAALCMYHDQALIPIKTIAFDDGVNVTLGLPFLRVSPDHGTAFDIAGKGIARADSLIAALRLGSRLAAQARSAA
ncbi:MAG: 4-hydroxythreonine-4-phosphate dehydrogenase PdxA [Salinarimonadaceae bacterium]|nr:MAG: 4-hydroxythreonine-4-phosphate dehydrogenase PdxA [Salinarimonadaceae bacterium]